MIGRKTISEEVLDYFKQWLSLTQSIPTAHQLAERFGISIEISDKSPKRGNLILRSEYSGNPPTFFCRYMAWSIADEISKIKNYFNRIT